MSYPQDLYMRCQLFGKVEFPLVILDSRMITEEVLWIEVEILSLSLLLQLLLGSKKQPIVP